MGAESPTRRLVDEWERNPVTGRYELRQKDVEFSAYIRSKGYNIIPVPGSCQLEYGCNCLNLGLSTVLSVHQKTARLIAHSPHFQGDVYYVPFDQVCGVAQRGLALAASGLR